MDIIELREKCTDETIAVTQHLVLRMRKRGIQYDEIVAAIQSGEIIEDYPDAFPFPA
jgi:hypothetical protein